MTINEFTHRKKPVEIAAKQFILGTSTKAEMLAFCPVANIGAHTDNDKDIRWFVIPTLEGDMEVRHLDYVIEGVEGEFYPCKPAIFEKTYDTIVPVVCEVCGKKMEPGEAWTGEGDRFWHDRCLKQGKPKAQIMLTHTGMFTRWAIVHETDGVPIYQHNIPYSSREEALTDARAWAKSEGWDVE